MSARERAVKYQTCPRRATGPETLPRNGLKRACMWSFSMVHLIAGEMTMAGVRMAGRWPVTASILVQLLAATTFPARAADPAFCRQYARAALVQVRGALASPHCG